MIEVIIEHRVSGEGKVVTAPAVRLRLLLEWIRNNHPGYKFVESRVLGVAA